MCLLALGQWSPFSASRECRAVVNNTDPELRQFDLNLKSITQLCCLGLGTEPHSTSQTVEATVAVR